MLADELGRNLLAYVGPGGGFAISVSLFAIVAVLLGTCLVVILTPLSALRGLLRSRRRRRHGFRKVVVLGLDGLDPNLCRKLMRQGKLPALSALAGSGHFGELQTTIPPLSPAAWSSFMTGCDASRHGIYDFIRPDPASYKPRLSTSEIVPPARALAVGPYRIPLGRSRVRALRKGVPFWHWLGRHGLEATVLRVPATFPPERFKGRLLSGMFVPDLLGSQGTYSYYATADRRASRSADGFHPLRFDRGVARTQIVGPRHPLLGRRRHLTIPLEVRLGAKDGAVHLRVQGRTIDLKTGRHSGWVPLRFRAGPIRAHGMVQFCLVCPGPEVQLYMTPVHIDPEHPAMPISHPRIFSDFLAKRTGCFGTLGLMEDTSALNDGVLDEEAFLQQAWGMYRERKAMFFHALTGGADDAVVCVFDVPDRIQHMFWRYVDADHPAGKSAGGGNHADAIERLYVEMDRLVAQTLERLPEKALLLVVSDHGFASFRRGVNLNAWLHRNGYLHLLPDADPAESWLAGVDWSATRAYAMGLTGIYINTRTRESRGIVDPGDEFEELTVRLKDSLEAMEDDAPAAAPAGSRRAIRRVFIARSDLQGPYRFDGPDLIVGYEAGYRCSWECANGQVAGEVFTDNTRAWSGDHCIDPELVPGVIFSNCPLRRDRPRIVDVGPTVLDVFGVAPAAPMQGVSLLKEADA